MPYRIVLIVYGNIKQENKLEEIIMKKGVGILKNIQQEILRNPYRLLGVTCEASIRDITRQSSRLKKYLLAGETPVDRSFSLLDTFQRIPEDIEQAVHAISTDESRLTHALFWFWYHNDITDEAAFESLKDNKPQEALEIWSKLIFLPGRQEFKEITEKNISAFHNWSLLKLIMAYVCPELGNSALQEIIVKQNEQAGNPNCQDSPKSINSREYQVELKHSMQSLIKEGILAQLKLLDSPLWKQFKENITDKTYQINQEQIELIFLNAILDMNEISFVADIFQQQFKARTLFLDRYFYSTQDSIRSIIENIKDAKAEDMSLLPQAAQKVNILAKKGLKGAKKILASEQYNQLSDQLAKELLQAAIAYFNYYRTENNKNAPKDFHLFALDILDLAYDFVCSESLKQIIDTNYKAVREYEFEEGMLALHALREAWKVCLDIEKRNSAILAILGQRYEVNSWKLGQLLEKFVTTRALKQLAASRDKEAILEADKLFEKLSKYINTSYWQKYLKSEDWKQHCLASYEQLPKDSIERLLALLLYVSKHCQYIDLFIPQIRSELSDKMFQRIAKANNNIQLKVWEAILKALDDGSSDFLRGIEFKLVAILPATSPLLKILKRREKYRLIRTWIILGIVTALISIVICGIHSYNVALRKDKADYEIVRNQDTVEAYEYFLSTSRTQQYVVSARARIRAINKEQARKKREAEERAWWENVKREKRYADYLEKYPGGTFSNEARAAIEKQEWGTEKVAWATAQKDNSLKSYQKYIQLYPTGAHIKQAQQKELEKKIDNYYSRSEGNLPSPTYTGYRESSSAFIIKNDTSGTLTVYFQGPITQQIKIKKDMRSTINLLNGTYRVVAVTEDDTPYTSSMTFKNGYYEADYYIHSYYVPKYSGNNYGNGRRRY